MLDDRLWKDMEPRRDLSSAFMRFWNAANERREWLDKAQLRHGEALMIWHIATGEGPVLPSDREGT